MKQIHGIQLLLLITLNLFSVTSFTQTNTIEREIIEKRLSLISQEIFFPFTDTIGYMIRNHIHSERSIEILSIFLTHQSYFDSLLISSNLPVFLSALPLTVSDMEPLYLSSTNAAGTWGLYAPAATLLGLELTQNIDSRYDIHASSIAAIQYLKYLYEEYQDWWTVILAYIHGPSAIQWLSEKNNYGHADPELILLHNTTEIRLTVIRFIYYSYFIHYYREHNIDIRQINKIRTISVHIQNPIILKDLLKVTEMEESLFHRLNPVYISNHIFPSDDFPIQLPEKIAEKFSEWKDSLYKWAIAPDTIIIKQNETEINSFTYFVRKGDNLGVIARRHKVSVNNLKKWNNLKNDIIYPGQKLIIYRKGYVPVQTATQNSQITLNPASLQGGYITYTVKQGDSLWSIAQKFDGVSDEDIRKLNALTNNKIYPGQKLKIKPEEQ